MRILILIILLLFPTGCNALRSVTKQVEVVEQTAPMYEEHEVDSIVEEAALKVAAHYPPAGPCCT